MSVIEPGEFIRSVRGLYDKDPGYVCGVPFWKLQGFIEQSTNHRLTEGDHTCLYTEKDGRLLFYWSDAEDRFMLPGLTDYSFMVLNEQHYNLAAREMAKSKAWETHKADPYYTLFFDFAFHDETDIPEGYRVESFSFLGEEDFVSAASLITSSSDSYKVTPERVRSWTETPVFAPELWVWVKDSAGTPVGIGVSNWNPQVMETDLDWIFVLPEHRGRGVGRAVIRHTIARSRQRSRIIRLSGIADGFYLKCGFAPKDKWFVVSR